MAALVASGALNDKLARQVIDGVLDGEGGPDEVVADRGLSIVSDDSALLAAIDEAIAANADVADEDPQRQGRGGRGAGRRGHEGHRRQADAPRGRELILKRLTFRLTLVSLLLGFSWCGSAQLFRAGWAKALWRR